MTNETKLKFWYNLETRQVEKGQISPSFQLMGPYDSYEQAISALERANMRAKRLAEEDNAWQNAGFAD